ncbi:MAG: hypothetical protein ACXIT9_10880 [Nitritalea sp.]
MIVISQNQCSTISGGGGFACAGSILLSVSFTLGAAAIVAGTGATGVLLLGYGLGKLGATASIIGNCGNI